MSLIEIHTQLRKIIFKWDGFLFNPNYVRKDNEITYSSASFRRHPFKIGLTYFENLVRNQEYSYQVEDGSILQFWYQFHKNNRELKNASLSFIKNPDSLIEWSDYEISTECAEDVLQIFYAENLLSWIRIDYDPNAQCSTIHPTCHLHCNLHPDMRIALLGVPTPDQFIDAIAAWFYPNHFKEHLLDDNYLFRDPESQKNKNSKIIVAMDRQLEHDVIFISLPN